MLLAKAKNRKIDNFQLEDSYLTEGITVDENTTSPVESKEEHCSQFASSDKVKCEPKSDEEKESICDVFVQDKDSEYFEEIEQGGKADTESRRSRSHDLVADQRSIPIPTTKCLVKRKASDFSFMKRSEKSQEDLTNLSSTNKSVLGVESCMSKTVLYATQSGIERFLQSAEVTAQLHQRN